MKTVMCFLFLVTVSLVSSLRLPVQQDFASADLLGCDSRCESGGGCYGEMFTRCMGVCYCIGSGFEYRCRNCDL